MIDSPTKIQRLAGAAFMAAVVVCLIIAFSFYLDSIGANQQSVNRATSFFTYIGIGAIFIGWKYPSQVLLPLRGFGSKNRHAPEDALPRPGKPGGTQRDLLVSSTQRALFAAGVAGLIPWFAMRVIRQLWTSDGLTNYLTDALLDPLFFWFNSDPWWNLGVPWYDYAALPSIGIMLLAIVWPWTGARLLSWVRGQSAQ